MFNKIKELLIGKKKPNNKTTKYGNFNVECIYHNNFIRLMNGLILLHKNENLIQNSNVFSSEKQTKIITKGEEVSLNNSNNIFKESVLYNIKNSVLSNGRSILYDSNIVLDISLNLESTDIVKDVFTILNTIRFYPVLKIYFIIDDDTNTMHIILSSNCDELIAARDKIETIANNNILAVSIINKIDSIIPKIGTRNGREYFTGLVDNIPDSIKPYKEGEFQVQVLSHDNELLSNKLIKKLDKKEMLSMQDLYLIIDNGLDLPNILFHFVYKIPEIDRYILRIRYIDIRSLFITYNELLSDKNINWKLKKIVDIIKETIPQEVFEIKECNSKDEYANVDEIIE